MVDFIKIYNEYIDERNEQNRINRYNGNEHIFGASSSGSCRRKLYYKHVEQAKKTDDTKYSSLRKMRLGTIFHTDMEEAIHHRNMYKDSHKEPEILSEVELEIPELNIRGFCDAIVITPDEMGNNDKVYLYDFKTTGSYPWKLKFGRHGKEQDDRYSLQIATYGNAVKKKFGRLDGMFLLYYNKDNSDMRKVEVPLEWLERSYKWWEDTKEKLETGLPKLSPGENPSASWECNYCEWKSHCLK